jgi:hypothetical protein
MKFSFEFSPRPPESAPICRPFFSAVLAPSGPRVRTATSVPLLASLRESATSKARSLISSATDSLAARSSSPVAGSILRSSQVSGTCFINTMIFTMRPFRQPFRG